GAAFFFDEGRAERDDERERDEDMRTPFGPADAGQVRAAPRSRAAGTKTSARRAPTFSKGRLELLCDPATGERLRRHRIERADHRRWLGEGAQREPLAVELFLERGDHRLTHADARELELGCFEADASGDPTSDARESA